MPRAQKHKTAQDVELTDVDSDSDVDLQPVRLPSGLPLDDPPPQISANSHLEVEQVCRRHLDNGYIPMSVFSWLAQTLPSELLRASALTRRGTPAMAFSVGAYYHAGSVGIRSNTKKYPCTAALLAHMVRACTHTQTSQPCPCCATSTWPPTWTGTTSQAPSMCSCRYRPSVVENSGLRKTADQTYPRKANIKDAITPFACRD